MEKKRLFPDYIFESSWEVCNKVGGIYTVLSTRAKTLTERLKDQLEKYYPENISIKEEYYYTKRILSKKREKLRKTFCQLKKI